MAKKKLSKEEKELQKLQSLLKRAKSICDLYAMDTNPIADCIEQSGISIKTWYNWNDENEEVRNMYDESKLKKAARNLDKLRELSATSLELLVTGQTVTTVKNEGVMIVGQVVDGEKQPDKMQVVKSVQTTKHYQPNVTAVIFALTNADPDNFKRNATIEHTGKGGKELPYAGFNFIIEKGFKTENE